MQNYPDLSDVGPSTQNFARGNDSKYNADGSAYPHRMVNSRISNNFGNDFEKMSSQQALNRTLPSSMLPSTSSADSNRSNNRNWGTYGSSHHSAGSSSTFNKSYPRDSSSVGNDNEVFVYENSGTRVLPPSMMHAKSAAAAAAHFATTSDSAYRSGAGEEKTAETDERLIYQAALEVCFSLIFVNIAMPWLVQILIVLFVFFLKVLLAYFAIHFVFSDKDYYSWSRKVDFLFIW